ncbi:MULTISPECIES: SCO3374 family protein [unclassified Streptomyces]|uniref:SCO3374 family protein n=1 Tax=unclassified Streptomyces TaxID=2593676 RepID=UPI0036A93604
MAGSVPATSSVPLPCRPSDPAPPGLRAYGLDPETGDRHWYENELGWPTVPGRPPMLVTGVRYDVLDVPAGAGAPALRHLGPGSPVALWGGRMRLLVAAGSAEELPGVLEWLEWRGLVPGLRALGEGCLMEAPAPPGAAHSAALPPARGSGAGRGSDSVQGAAVWLRPPGPGGEVEASLPALPAAGGPTGAPDLVRLVDTLATHCHRARLRPANARPPACGGNQPLAFS